jgi:hypothetical protein
VVQGLDLMMTPTALLYRAATALQRQGLAVAAATAMATLRAATRPAGLQHQPGQAVWLHQVSTWHRMALRHREQGSRRRRKKRRTRRRLVF